MTIDRPREGDPGHAETDAVRDRYARRPVDDARYRLT